MNETTNNPHIHIVDDDEAVRDSLSMLLKAEGFSVATYESGDNFLEALPEPAEGCILLDIRMPGTSGIEVQQILLQRKCTLPIIFITGHGDVPMAVEAMQSGAFDFIQKPFRDDELIEKVRQAHATHLSQKDEIEQRMQAEEKLTTLTPREREVMDMVTRGLANKVIAIDLGLSQRTVEIHRSRVMEKMTARSLAELVRMTVLLDKG